MKQLKVPVEIVEFESGEQVLYYENEDKTFTVIPVFSSIQVSEVTNDEAMLRLFHEIAVSNFTKKLTKSILTNESK